MKKLITTPPFSLLAYHQKLVVDIESHDTINIVSDFDRNLYKVIDELDKCFCIIEPDPSKRYKYHSLKEELDKLSVPNCISPFDIRGHNFKYSYKCKDIPIPIHNAKSSPITLSDLIRRNTIFDLNKSNEFKITNYNSILLQLHGFKTDLNAALSKLKKDICKTEDTKKEYEYLIESHNHCLDELSRWETLAEEICNNNNNIKNNIIQLNKYDIIEGVPEYKDMLKTHVAKHFSNGTVSINIGFIGFKKLLNISILKANSYLETFEATNASNFNLLTETIISIDYITAILCTSNNIQDTTHVTEISMLFDWFAFQLADYILVNKNYTEIKIFGYFHGRAYAFNTKKRDESKEPIKPPSSMDWIDFILSDKVDKLFDKNNLKYADIQLSPLRKITLKLPRIAILIEWNKRVDQPIRELDLPALANFIKHSVYSDNYNYKKINLIKTILKKKDYSDIIEIIRLNSKQWINGDHFNGEDLKCHDASEINLITCLLKNWVGKLENWMTDYESIDGNHKIINNNSNGKLDNNQMNILGEIFGMPHSIKLKDPRPIFTLDVDDKIIRFLGIHAKPCPDSSRNAKLFWCMQNQDIFNCTTKKSFKFEIQVDSEHTISSLENYEFLLFLICLFHEEKNSAPTKKRSTRTSESIDKRQIMSNNFYENKDEQAAKFELLESELKTIESCRESGATALNFILPRLESALTCLINKPNDLVDKELEYQIDPLWINWGAILAEILVEIRGFIVQAISSEMDGVADLVERASYSCALLEEALTHFSADDQTIQFNILVSRSLTIYADLSQGTNYLKGMLNKLSEFESHFAHHNADNVKIYNVKSWLIATQKSLSDLSPIDLKLDESLAVIDSPLWKFFEALELPTARSFHAQPDWMAFCRNEAMLCREEFEESSMEAESESISAHSNDTVSSDLSEQVEVLVTQMPGSPSKPIKSGPIGRGLDQLRSMVLTFADLLRFEQQYGLVALSSPKSSAAEDTAPQQAAIAVLKPTFNSKGQLLITLRWLDSTPQAEPELVVRLLGEPILAEQLQWQEDWQSGVDKRLTISGIAPLSIDLKSARQQPDLPFIHITWDPLEGGRLELDLLPPAHD